MHHSQLATGLLVSSGNPREEQNEVFFFLMTVLISTYVQMYQPNEVVSLQRTAALSLLEASEHQKDFEGKRTAIS